MADDDALPFKACRLCDCAWTSRDAFLTDPEIELLGFQTFADHPERGLLLFNHLLCRTTLAVGVSQFEDLYAGPIFSERLARTERCELHCFDPGDLSPCQQACSAAWVRDVLGTVERWPKKHEEKEKSEGGAA